VRISCRGVRPAGVMQKNGNAHVRRLAAVRTRDGREACRQRPRAPPAASIAGTADVGGAVVAVIADPTGAPVGVDNWSHGGAAMSAQ